ncbi:TerB family tellurite resistance protein [Sulfitobacter sabulilitoris]|uniref:TerB family tellurite resistance protein n=1 Tax=Sulfitobacter sabulilitoris TaxID=2562655 RepID=A0A5S3PGR9_9RHOB|nr:TerB family tellurite resistance protein [Sulfitobacter sabulilitoris]TMM50842.1 TerB family tellurite resistance protein [Sulfitobacter sabulilitoris]
MFADFIKRLTQPDPVHLPDDDARLALTALLVRIARADQNYSDTEKERIDQITAKRYDLGPGAVTALRAEAELLEAEAPDTVRFTRAIKDAVPYDERLRVVEALWKVVLADGTRAEEEDAVVRMATKFLGVSDPDSAMARQKVEGTA